MTTNTIQSKINIKSFKSISIHQNTGKVSKMVSTNGKANGNVIVNCNCRYSRGLGLVCTAFMPSSTTTLWIKA
eukprot:1817079-Amphidinium_carterae.1